jgi:hypothetical protein
MNTLKTPNVQSTHGTAYCPMCTHTVPAMVQTLPKRPPSVVPGQKCSRCAAALDAGIVFSVQRAA